MIPVRKSTRQDRSGILLDGEWVAVPDQVDWTVRDSVQFTYGLPLAVRARELDNGDAGRASRHIPSVEAADAGWARS
jgi:hypothetical protein